MNLRKFKENYYITSQELVFAFYDIELHDEVDADDDLDNVTDYTEQDEFVPTGGKVTYTIYTSQGVEVYETDQEQELLDKVKELANELN